MFIFPGGGGGGKPFYYARHVRKNESKGVYTGIFCLFYYCSPNIKIDTLVVRHPAAVARALTFLHCT